MSSWVIGPREQQFLLLFLLEERSETDKDERVEVVQVAPLSLPLR